MKAKIQKAFDQHINPRLSPAFKATAILQGFGLWKVPLLFSVQPKVREISAEKLVVEIPLRRWSKNHLGSMYFGAQAMGADCVVGLLAMHIIDAKGGGNVHLSFKDFKADFLRRAESHVVFVCEEGKKISKFVDQILTNGERGNLTVKAHAALASNPEEVVSKFELTLSLKKIA